MSALILLAFLAAAVTATDVFLGWRPGPDREPVARPIDILCEGMLVEGRTGGGKTAFLIGTVATQLLLHRFGLIVLSGKLVNAWMGWFHRLGLDPQLVTLQRGKRTRAVPLIRLLWRAGDGLLWRVAEGVASVLVRTGDSASHGQAHFYSSNVAVVLAGLEVVGPSGTLGQLHAVCRDLLISRREEFGGGSHAVNALGMAARCPLLDPMPGMADLDIAAALRPDGLALVVGDTTGQPEHTKLLLRAVVEVMVATVANTPALRGRCGLIADDVAAALMQGGWSAGAAAQMRGSAAFVQSAQDAGGQTQSKHGSAGEATRAITGARVIFSADAAMKRDILFESGERTVIDRSTGQSVVAGWGGRVTDTNSERPRVTTRLTIDELNRLFAQPGHGILMAGGQPEPFRMQYPTDTREEWLALEAASWPEADRPAPPPPPAPKPPPEEAMDRAAAELLRRKPRR